MMPADAPPAIPDQPAEGDEAWADRCARRRELEAAAHAEAVRWSKELGMGGNVSEPASDLITVRDYFQQVQGDLNDTLEHLETVTAERDRARDVAASLSLELTELREFVALATDDLDPELIAMVPDSWDAGYGLAMKQVAQRLDEYPHGEGNHG
jgi:hypothetical protein